MKFKIWKFKLDIKGLRENTTPKSRDLNNRKIKETAPIYALSPIRFSIIAFKADFVADILVCQKLINKKEQIPMPSQPKNKTIKLSPVIKINIKKVNRDNREKNLIRLESLAI